MSGLKVAKSGLKVDWWQPVSKLVFAAGCRRFAIIPFLQKTAGKLKWILVPVRFSLIQSAVNLKDQQTILQIPGIFYWIIVDDQEFGQLIRRRKSRATTRQRTNCGPDTYKSDFEPFTKKSGNGEQLALFLGSFFIPRNFNYFPEKKLALLNNVCYFHSC